MPQKTRKLLLMRHAKSLWNDQKLKDFDRPLNKRGERDAPRMGRFLKEMHLFPDQIFSSPAERAKLTILKVIRELNLPVSAITWDENLYFSGADSYLHAIQNADDRSEVVMVVGHNPMIEDTVSVLSGHTSDKAIKTATIVCFEFKTDAWKNLQYGAGSLKWITGPKDFK